MTAGQALAGTTNDTPQASTTPQANGTTGSDDTSSGSATISANDFLTLLVTEMQNQDPTADTDPNEYINQLVQVNSLEQLIDINQTLSGDVGGTSSGSGSGSGSSTQVAAAPNDAGATSPLTAGSAQAGRAGNAATAATSTAGSSHVQQAATSSFAASHAPGNLGVPGVNAAAQHVGHALDGHAHVKPTKGSAIALQ